MTTAQKVLLIRACISITFLCITRVAICIKYNYDADYELKKLLSEVESSVNVLVKNWGKK